MSLSLIVAMTPAGLIGRGNALPWHLSEDLKRFKQTTMGHALIMGRKTFESIGKPLPGRRNMVLSRDESYAPPGVEVVAGWDEAIEALGGASAFVIGGRSLYELALPRVDKAMVTIVHGEFEGDAYFSELDWDKFFEVESRSGRQVSENGIEYEFINYVKRA